MRPLHCAHHACKIAPLSKGLSLFLEDEFGKQKMNAATKRLVSAIKQALKDRAGKRRLETVGEFLRKRKVKQP